MTAVGRTTLAPSHPRDAAVAVVCFGDMPKALGFGSAGELVALLVLDFQAVVVAVGVAAVEG